MVVLFLSWTFTRIKDYHCRQKQSVIIRKAEFELQHQIDEANAETDQMDHEGQEQQEPPSPPLRQQTPTPDAEATSPRQIGTTTFMGPPTVINNSNVIPENPLVVLENIANPVY